MSANIMYASLIYLTKNNLNHLEPNYLGSHMIRSIGNSGTIFSQYIYEFMPYV